VTGLFLLQLALMRPQRGEQVAGAVPVSGNPEISQLPFTTRSIKMGHFFVNQVRLSGAF
jgi:hypothetical protein